MSRRSMPRTRTRLLPVAAAAPPAQLVPLAPALEQLRQGLAGRPREIPCKYFYDDRGSALFEQITALPEYYPTRTEGALIAAQAGAIVEAAGGAHLCDVVELGSGAATKTLPLLAAAGRPRYVAVDISAHALGRTRALIGQARPDVRVESVLADYSRDYALPAKPAEGRRLALFLGGTIGNDQDPDAIAFLTRVREHLSPGDTMLLGANLVCDPAVIHLAYNDAAGVTAAFNRNVLTAINALAQSRFEPDDFEHHAPYDVEHRRIEMWLVARRALDIDLGRMGGSLRLEKGEGIRTEISRRFRRDEVLRLLDAAGFTPDRWFESPDGRFGLGLGRARGALRGL